MNNATMPFVPLPDVGTFAVAIFPLQSRSSCNLVHPAGPGSAPLSLYFKKSRRTQSVAPGDLISTHLPSSTKLAGLISAWRIEIGKVVVIGPPDEMIRL